MTKRRNEDEQWDRRKDTIHELYMEQRLGLPTVMHMMDENKAQYERNFARWEWRKNLKRNEWNVVQDYRQKSKAIGKPESDLIIGERLVAKDKVRRGIERHGFASTLERLQGPIEQHKIAVRSAYSTIEDHYLEFLAEALEALPSRALVLQFFRSIDGVQLSDELGDLNVKPGNFHQFLEQLLQSADRIAGRSVPFLAKRIIRALAYYVPQSRRMETLPSTNATYQQAFLELAVTLKSNAHEDFGLDDIILGLSLEPRNRDFIHTLISRDLPSTGAFAENLLFPAVQRGNANLLSDLIAFGIDPLSTKRYSMGPSHGACLTNILDLAVDTGQAEMMHAVLKSWVNLLSERSSAITACVAQSVHNALELASVTDDISLIQILRHGVPEELFCHCLGLPDSIHTFYSMGLSGSCKALLYLLDCLKDSHGVRAKASVVALVGGAAGGHLPLVKELVQQGGDPNGVMEGFDEIYESTPLNAASSRSHADVVKYLLEQGADPNLCDPNYAAPVYPLGPAVFRDDEEIVNLLLRRGADPHRPTSRRSWLGGDNDIARLPIQIAAEIGSESVFCLLLKWGHCPPGRDILRAAIKSGSPQILKCVLEANPHLEFDSHDLLFRTQELANSPDVRRPLELFESGKGLDDRNFYKVSVITKGSGLMQSFIGRSKDMYNRLPPICGASVLDAATLRQPGPIRKYFSSIGVTSLDYLETTRHTSLSPSSELFSDEKALHRMKHVIGLLKSVHHCDEKSCGARKREQYHYTVGTALGTSISHEFWDDVNNSSKQPEGPHMMQTSLVVLSPHRHQRSDLFKAICRGNIVLVQQILGDDGQHNVHDLKEVLNESLCKAVETGNCDIASFLLTRGADPNDITVHSKLFHRRTKPCLFFAVESSNFEMVRLLLKHGARPDIAVPDCQSCPGMLNAIGLAASAGHLTIMKSLLEAGGNVNKTVYRNGETALSAAAGNGRLDMVSYLLQVEDGEGDDTDHQEHYQRAVWRAWNGGHLTIARIILESKTKKYGLAAVLSLSEIIEKGERHEFRPW